MGVMTVAPSTGVLIPPFDAAPRTAVRCTSCGTAAVAREPFCAHCGSRVAFAVSRGTRPADLAATRSLQLAVLAVAVNILIGGVSFGVVYLVADAARLTEAALGLEAMRFLVVGSLVVLAIRSGVRGLRDTRDGQLRRRGWAVAGIVLASIFGLLVTLSLLATFALYVL